MSELHKCQRCPRLTNYRIEQKAIFPGYQCLPVAGFGAADAKLLIVGLAPGLHGANASGRPFTGDASGDMLFATLHKYGFASRAESLSRHDNMHLDNCRITNAVKCAPPQNRPNGDEIKLVVPGPKKYIQIRCKIIHFNKTGFGVRFKSILKIDKIV